MKEKDYFVLYNSNSRDNHPRELDKVVGFCIKHDIGCQHIVKKEDIYQILETLVISKIRKILVLGGDGTIRNIVSAIIRLKLEDVFEIFPLGGGTMNAICQTIMGLRFSPYKNLQDFLSRYDPLVLANKQSSLPLYSHKIHALCIDHNGVVRYGFYFFIGPIARVINQVYDHKHSAWKAMFVIFISLFAAIFHWPKSYFKLFSPMKMKLRMNDTLCDQRQSLLFSMSMFKHLIILIKPFRGVLRSNQGHFISYDMPIWQVTLFIFFLIRGVLPHRSFNQFINCPIESLRLQLFEDDNVNIDGEKMIFSKYNEIFIKISDKPIHFLSLKPAV